jgi:hypothetical protein
LNALPRPEENILEEEIRPKSAWTIPKSVFAQYQWDTDEHLNKCFEMDWNCSKIEKLIRSKNEKEKIKVKNYLKQHYRPM